MNGSGEVQPQTQFEMPALPENPPQAGEISNDRALEAGNPDENRVGKQQPPMPAVDPASLALPGAPVDTQAPTASASATTAVDDDGLTAKDGDKIEKQWVEKAKSIIAQTQDDPFIQKNEMSKVKAEYIQKRFKKTIPMGDTAEA